MIIGEIDHLAQISIGNELLSEALKWVAEHYKDNFEKGTTFIRDDKRIKVNAEIVAMLPQGKQMLQIMQMNHLVHIYLQYFLYKLHINYLNLYLDTNL